MHRPEKPKLLMITGVALAVAGVGALLAGGGDQHQQPAGPAAAGAKRVAVTRGLLAADMSKPSEARPNGVPATYDWASVPRSGLNLGRASRFRAFTAWGQLYTCAGTSPNSRTRVELDGMQSFVFSRRQRRWIPLQVRGPVTGADYPEDYQGASKPWRVRDAGAGSVSVQLRKHYNVHFWPISGRARFDARDAEAVAVSVRARIDDSTSGRSGCFVLSAGGDFWRSQRSDEPASSVVDFGIGRFKRVERSWRTYTASAGSKRVLRTKPPPLGDALSELR